jgi:hypothetical protein
MPRPTQAISQVGCEGLDHVLPPRCAHFLSNRERVADAQARRTSGIGRGHSIRFVLGSGLVEEMSHFVVDGAIGVAAVQQRTHTA